MNIATPALPSLNLSCLLWSSVFVRASGVGRALIFYEIPAWLNAPSFGIEVHSASPPDNVFVGEKAGKTNRLSLLAVNNCIGKNCIGAE